MNFKNLKTIVNETIKEVKDHTKEIVFYSTVCTGLLLSPLARSGEPEGDNLLKASPKTYTCTSQFKAGKLTTPPETSEDLETCLKDHKIKDHIQKAGQALSQAFSKKGKCEPITPDKINKYTFTFNYQGNLTGCKKELIEEQEKKAEPEKKPEKGTSQKHECTIEIPGKEKMEDYTLLPIKIALENCLRDKNLPAYEKKTEKIFRQGFSGDEKKCLGFVPQIDKIEYSLVLDEEANLIDCQRTVYDTAQLPPSKEKLEEKPEGKKEITKKPEDRLNQIDSTLENLKTEQGKINQGLTDLDSRLKDYKQLQSQVQELTSPENKFLNKTFKEALKKDFEELTQYKENRKQACQEFKAKEKEFKEQYSELPKKEAKKDVCQEYKDYQKKLKEELPLCKACEGSEMEKKCDQLQKLEKECNLQELKEKWDEAKARYNQKYSELTQTIKRNLTDKRQLSITPFVGGEYNDALYGLAGAKASYGKGWNITAKAAALVRGHTQTKDFQEGSENTTDVGYGYQEVGSLDEKIKEKTKYMTAAGVGVETPNLSNQENFSLNFNLSLNGYLGEKTRDTTLTQTSQLQDTQSNNIGEPYQATATETDKEIIYSLVPKLGAEICYKNFCVNTDYGYDFTRARDLKDKGRGSVFTTTAGWKF